MRASRVLPAGAWASAEEIDAVAADFDARYRRRVVLRTQSGQDLLVDLPSPAHLHDGDGLALDAGGVVRVIAVAEELVEITAANPQALLRIAWHLGNRHLAVQFVAGACRIRADHVIAEMVRGLGAEAREIASPFDPEPGAYALGHHHGHGGDHEH